MTLAALETTSKSTPPLRCLLLWGLIALAHDKSIAANEAQYNTGDFCIDEGSGDCDAVIRTKGWKFSGPTGALNCGSGTSGIGNY